MTRATFFLLFLIVRCYAADSWQGLKFSEVRAYAWPDCEGASALILEEMTLKAGVINPKGAVLTAEQTQSLIKSVTDNHPEYPVAGCYRPHNAFVFYDASKKPVAFIEICFECDNHRIEPKGAADYLDLVGIAAIFDAHKLPMGKFLDLAAYKGRFDHPQETMKQQIEAAELEIGTIVAAKDEPPNKSDITVSYDYDGKGRLALSLRNISMNAAARSVTGSVVVNGGKILIQPKEHYDSRGPVESLRWYTIQYVIPNIQTGRYSLVHDDSAAEGTDRVIKTELDLTIAGKGTKTVTFKDPDPSEDPFAEP